MRKIQKFIKKEAVDQTAFFTERKNESLLRHKMDDYYIDWRKNGKRTESAMKRRTAKCRSAKCRSAKCRPKKQKKHRIAKMGGERHAEYILDCLHLPKDVIMGSELSMLLGNSEMEIRNFKKLLSCREDEICVLAGCHRIRIKGRCLALAYFAAEEVKVTGRIESICYEG